jgi:hypothetical protein
VQHRRGGGPAAVGLLIALGVDWHLTDLPDAIVRRYVRRLAARPPAVAARPSQRFLPCDQVLIHGYTLSTSVPPRSNRELTSLRAMSCVLGQTS